MKWILLFFATVLAAFGVVMLRRRAQQARA
jgi:hypothetical protein